MQHVNKLAVTTIAVLAASSPSAMASGICNELWFIRNWVMSQAGYCFGTALGQAQFDNAGCTGQQITLPPASAAFVTEMRRRESALGCSVDTGRSTLDMPDLALRKRLERQPVPHEGDNMEGWGCLGYVGPQVALHSAPNAGSAQVGRIETGDWVGVGGYEAVEGWLYVTTHGPSWSSFRSGGWMLPGQTIRCEAEAG